MPATFEPIATTTLGSNAATITFSSIPSTYTDLRLVLSCPGLSAADFPYFQFVTDTGANYSITRLRGNGTAASASQQVSTTSIQAMNASITGSVSFFLTLDVNNYSSSSIFKTALISYNASEYSSGNIGRCIGLWRSTNTITRIDIKTNNGNSYTTNTIATLYGILKA